MLRANTQYESIFFSGSGFLAPFHFGAIKCLQDNNITFKEVAGLSGGSMAALVFLNGANLELGIRQCFDILNNEQCKFPSYNLFPRLTGLPTTLQSSDIDSKDKFGDFELEFV